jgi:pimeloyl-ACP methyl ester carboxylesterase
MFSFRSETRELNDAARQQTGGSYIQLSEGITHYELGNPTRDQTVILVLGFSVPYFIYDPTFHFLTQHGFRAVRYDLFGRGYSDRPQADYDIDFFVKQLEDLLESLLLSQPVSLAGLSMGGPITATFTSRHPDRVDRLVLIDPVGARPIPLSWLLKAGSLPFVGEALLALFGRESMVRNIASDFSDEKLDRHFLDQYIEQMQYKGFRRAILSTIRNHMLNSCMDVYRKVGLLNKPVLLIWGRQDTLVPVSQSEDLLAAIPQIEFYIIEDSSHIPHYEKSEETNAILLDFLRKP